ncbi:MAG: phosphoribosylanthranilate isomerase [Thermoplasmata archaeon]
MKPLVQICGITSMDDAALCSSLGADALGFVNVEGRSRYLSLDHIKKAVGKVGEEVTSTLITFSRDVQEIIRCGTYTKVDALQVYGVDHDAIGEIQEAGFEVISTILVDPETGLPKVGKDEFKRFANSADLVLLEPVNEGKIGGLGHDYDYSVLRPLLEHEGRFGVAGGLSPDNVHQALKLNPYAVHVSSGVESVKGRKDSIKVKEFIKKVKT